MLVNHHLPTPQKNNDNPGSIIDRALPKTDVLLQRSSHRAEFDATCKVVKTKAMIRFAVTVMVVLQIQRTVTRLF